MELSEKSSLSTKNAIVRTMFPLTWHETGVEHSHMKTWHYVAIAVVLAIIVLAILFLPIGGLPVRLPF